jgi:DNA mismatch repair protein MutS2
VHEHSLSLLEYDRVVRAIAERAASPRARDTLERWRPIADGPARREEVACLRDALAREAEPEAWCHVGPGDLAALLEDAAERPLDGPELVVVRDWLEAAEHTRAAWADPDARERHARLTERVESLPRLPELFASLDRALEPDGRVRDSASPALARARRDVERGERDLHARLEKWAGAFGPDAYVTRHGDRFVALVPAAGFPRRRAVVHDVSGSGQSLFVEPIEACEANNHLIEMRALASDEERRILRALADRVHGTAPELVQVDAVLVHLDTLRARARWGRELGAAALAPEGDALRLVQARHPLLAMGGRRDSVVPLDLTLGAEGRILLVSGPNMGGKTVLLKTVGLAVAMAHAAVPVPASEGSRIPEITRILVDLGDEQSVDRGLSTFAAHLEVMARMARHAGPETLLLCDEVGAGTDPEEGAALGRALLEHVAARGAWGILTTHYGSLKRAGSEIEGVRNGSLEFDAETLEPRYRFLAGVPGASHALDVASRLGFPEELLARARSLTPDESRALERLLADLHATRRTLEAERESLRLARDRAEAEAVKLSAAEAAARRELRETRGRLTRESDVLLAHARELWQTVREEARRSDRTRADAERLRREIGRVESEAESLRRAAEEAAARAGDADARGGAPYTPRPGDRVRVRDLHVEAVVADPADPEGRVRLQRGTWTIQSHVSQLEPVAAAADANARPVRATWEGPAEGAGLEVDMRGMEVEEALRELDRGLDRAVLQGLSELRIIHGVGKGVLRAAVERHLRGHPQVSSARLGGLGEGGRGVTVAHLR